MSASTGYERFKKIQSMIERIGAWTAACIILLMGLLITTDVTMRFFLIPFHGAMEVASFMMIGVVYFAVAYVQGENAHIKMDFIVRRLPPRTIIWFDFSVHLLALAIFSLATWQACLVAYRTWIYKDYASGILQAPFWPSRTALAIGIGLLCLRFIFDIIDDIQKFRGFYPLMEEEGKSV